MCAFMCWGCSRMRCKEIKGPWREGEGSTIPREPASSELHPSRTHSHTCTNPHCQVRSVLRGAAVHMVLGSTPDRRNPSMVKGLHPSMLRALCFSLRFTGKTPFLAQTECSQLTEWRNPQMTGLSQVNGVYTFTCGPEVSVA